MKFEDWEKAAAMGAADTTFVATECPPHSGRFIGVPEEIIKDSGERREFSSGAVRDVSVGKGDMFSLPAAAILRLSRHYELGAKKYTRLNYQRGIPVSSFMDSALRHIFKYLDGWDDEDHLSAAAFNILGAIQMEERNPDMQDIEARKGKNTFSYPREEKK